MSDAQASGTGCLAELLTRVAALDASAMSDVERIDFLTAAEQAKSALAAAQARVTVAFEASQRAVGQGEGVAAQVALAGRESPARGRRWVGVAKALVGELPATYAALAAGEVSEYAASLVVAETAFLTRERRQAVDAELATTPGGIGSLGPRRLAGAARGLGYRLDPASAVRRRADAVRQRRVSVRPAPETMAYLTALLPVAEAVRCYATLRRDAATATSTGAAEHRSQAQVMADLLTARLTGTRTAGAAAGAGPVEVHLVMTDAALLADDTTATAAQTQEPAWLDGYGLVPAALARDLVRAADQAWVRRLWTLPASGDLVAMDSRRRVFEGQLRRFLILRDQTCRTPWCEAPIRHADHVVPAAADGPTTARNGQGLCEACNYTKQSRALTQTTGHDGTITTTTRTGHRYRSRPPRPPGAPPPVDWTHLETHLTEWIDDQQTSAMSSTS